MYAVDHHVVDVEEVHIVNQQPDDIDTDAQESQEDMTPVEKMEELDNLSEIMS